MTLTKGFIGSLLSFAILAAVLVLACGIVAPRPAHAAGIHSATVVPGVPAVHADDHATRTDAPKHEEIEMSDTQEKMAALDARLSRGVAMLHVDATRAGVVVPERYRSEPHLRLNLSHRYEDVDIKKSSSAGLEATLSFGGSPYRRSVPWDAVFAVSQSGRLMAWRASMPAGVRFEEPRPPARRLRLVS